MPAGVVSPWRVWASSMSGRSPSGRSGFGWSPSGSRCDPSGSRWGVPESGSRYGELSGSRCGGVHCSGSLRGPGAPSGSRRGGGTFPGVRGGRGPGVVVCRRGGGVRERRGGAEASYHPDRNGSDRRCEQDRWCPSMARLRGWGFQDRRGWGRGVRAACRRDRWGRCFLRVGSLGRYQGLRVRRVAWGRCWRGRTAACWSVRAVTWTWTGWSCAVWRRWTGQRMTGWRCPVFVSGGGRNPGRLGCPVFRSNRHHCPALRPRRHHSVRHRRVYRWVCRRGWVGRSV